MKEKCFITFSPGLPAEGAVKGGVVVLGRSAGK
jgi:hypothetical protein